MFYINIRSELTAVGGFPPVTDHNTQSGAGLGVAAQSRTQALSHTAATVTCPLDAGLEIIKSAICKSLIISNVLRI